MHRRDFLKHSSLGASALVLPALLQPRVLPAVGDHGRCLVIVHLQGGNDGLNTLVPFGSDAYYRKRPKLAIAPGDVIRLNNVFGFNPACRSLMPAYEKGQLLVLNNVRYPGVHASHYTACRYWEENFHRMMAGQNISDGAVHKAGIHHSESMIDTQDSGVCDESDFENKLLRISTAIGARRMPGVYKIALDGFDTHQFQRLKQDRLLAVYSNAIYAFINKLSLAGQLDRTLVLTWSEFGRSVAENAKHGTEHGCAHPVFLFGGNLKQAGIANTPSSQELSGAGQEIDLATVLTTIQEKWLYDHHAATATGINWI